MERWLGTEDVEFVYVGRPLAWKEMKSREEPLLPVALLVPLMVWSRKEVSQLPPGPPASSGPPTLAVGRAWRTLDTQ
jgi:hypothetical protein